MDRQGVCCGSRLALKVSTSKYQIPRRMADARLAAKVVSGEVVLPEKSGAQAQAPARAGQPSTPAAAGAASSRPPMPEAEDLNLLVHSPPTDPIGRPAKKSRKKKAS